MDYKKSERIVMNNAKNVLMLLVVLYHGMLCCTGISWGPQSAYQTSRILYFVAQFLNCIHIYAFTFVSGYVYAYLRYETDRYSDWKAVIFRKTRRLLLPYVAAAIFWVIPFYCFFWRPSAKELAVKYLLGVAPSQLWFLLMLFWQFAIFQPLTKRITLQQKNEYLFLAAFLFLYYLSTVMSVLHVPNAFQILTALKYSLFFYLGIIFRRTNTKKYISWKVLGGGTITTALLFAGQQILLSQGVLSKAIAMGISPFVSIFGTYSFIIACLLLNGKSPEGKASVIQKSGMTVYLFHQQIIYLSICLFNKPWMPPAVLTLLNFVVGLSGGIAIYLILRKWKITRFLFAIGE